MQFRPPRAMTLMDAAERISQLLADQEPQVTPAPVPPVTPAPLTPNDREPPKLYPRGWEHAPGIKPLYPLRIVPPPGAPTERWNPRVGQWEEMPYRSYFPTPVINPDAIPGQDFPNIEINPTAPGRMPFSLEFMPISSKDRQGQAAWQRLLARMAPYRI